MSPPPANDEGKVRPCPSCGTEGSGNYCIRCGASLASGERGCDECGAPLPAGAKFCGECGEPVGGPAGAPVGGRPGKPLAARFPWILSAVVLAAFAAGIAVLVQRWSAPRPPGGMITGGIPGAEPAAGADGAGGGMPTAAELAAMPPRVAADRLFDRAMREAEAGDTARARFFAQMGLEAYQGVPPAEMDGDARFHVGLLHLLLGSPEAARAQAAAVLRENPDHLLALVLAAWSARAAGDTAGAEDLRRRLREALSRGESSADSEYAPHRELIEREAESALPRR